MEVENGSGHCQCSELYCWTLFPNYWLKFDERLFSAHLGSSLEFPKQGLPEPSLCLFLLLHDCYVADVVSLQPSVPPCWSRTLPYHLDQDLIGNSP